MTTFMLNFLLFQQPAASETAVPAAVTEPAGEAASEDQPTPADASSTPAVVPRSASSGDILEDTRTHDNMSAMSTSMSSPIKSVTDEASDSKPKFKSPLLQSLVDNKGNDSSSSPKFKSPLLNSLLGKNKMGARMALSASMDNLSQKEGRDGRAASPGIASGAGEESGSNKEISKQGKDEDKDEDTSPSQSSHSNGLTNWTDNRLQDSR